MKKIFMLFVLISLFLLSSCILFQKPLYLTYNYPTDEMILLVPTDLELKWESSIEKFHGEIKHDVLFGKDKNNLERIAKDITEKQFLIDQSNFDFSQTYYWQIIAKAEKREDVAGEIRSINVEEDNITVTNAQGGPKLNSLIYKIVENDLLITKKGFSTARIQNYSKEYHYNIPLRPIFNKDWTSPPLINIFNLDYEKTYNGDIEFDFEINAGKNDVEAWFVFVGTQAHEFKLNHEKESQVNNYIINTTLFPNGKTYIRIMAYNKNGDMSTVIVPLNIHNEQTDENLPGKIPAVNVTSLTAYSNPYLKSVEEKNYFIRNYLYWDESENTNGYLVYRSFDGEKYDFMGIVNGEKRIYEDYSGKLAVGKKTYYKIIPYNSKGNNYEEAVIRKVIPAPPIEIKLKTPNNNSKNIEINSEFTWELNRIDENLYSVEENYIKTNTKFSIQIWDLNSNKIYDDELFEVAGENIKENIYTYYLNEENFTMKSPQNSLLPGYIYVWDIVEAEEEYIYEDYGEEGISNALSLSNVYMGVDYSKGSINGGFLFTTKNEEKINLVNSVIFDYENSNYLEDVVMVKYFNYIKFEEKLKEYNSEIIKNWEGINWCIVKVPEEEKTETFIKKLLKEKTVVVAQPQFIYELPEINSNIQYAFNSNIGEEIDTYKLWGLKTIKAEEAWEITTGSENVVIAIIDSGIDIHHPEFDSNAMIPGFDASGQNDEDKDFIGHGTHVAGTAGAYGRDGIIAGVAWNCQIMPVKIANSYGKIVNKIDAFMYVADFVERNPEKRVVVNYSIGQRNFDFAEQDAIDLLISKGVVFVTSSGNDKKRIPSFPKTISGVISVAAITPEKEKAEFSTIGQWVSVAAPGAAIYSTLPTEQGSYGWMNGTSMASPHVAGAAALLLSVYPELTPIQVKNQLEETANDKGKGYTEELGYGIIDLVKMLGEIKPNKYGNLMLNTNLAEKNTAGIIAIYNSKEELVSWGSTGNKGFKEFSDLLSGEYTFFITFFDETDYRTYSNTVNIEADEQKIINLNFE